MWTLSLAMVGSTSEWTYTILRQV